MSLKYTVTERFLRYVQIDTQSDPESNTFPSTEKHNENEEETLVAFITLVFFSAPTSSPPSPHIPDLK
jgi:hypothetical protein